MKLLSLGGNERDGDGLRPVQGIFAGGNVFNGSNQHLRGRKPGPSGTLCAESVMVLYTVLIEELKQRNGLEGPKYIVMIRSRRQAQTQYSH